MLEQMFVEGQLRKGKKYKGLFDEQEVVESSVWKPEEGQWVGGAAASPLGGDRG